MLRHEAARSTHDYAHAVFSLMVTAIEMLITYAVNKPQHLCRNEKAMVLHNKGCSISTDVARLTLCDRRIDDGCQSGYISRLRLSQWVPMAVVDAASHLVGYPVTFSFVIFVFLQTQTLKCPTA